MKTVFKFLIVVLVPINSVVFAQIDSPQVNPGDVNLLKSLGGSFLKVRDYEKVFGVYESLISKQKLPDAYLSLGRAYFKVGSYKNADSVFSKLIELEPDTIRGYLWRARANSGIDPKSEQGLARHDYKRVIKLGSRDEKKYRKELVEAHRYFGYYYYVADRHSKSKSSWQKAFKLDPDNPQVSAVMKALKDQKRKSK